MPLKMKKPHVIIINPDQMRADSLHHLGNPAAVTPNLDKIVREDAVSFDSAFCQNPICTPSRCSFFTGLYPHVFGHRTISFMQYQHEPSLLKTMKENGYHVWMNDRNDFLPAQVPEIFDKYCDELYIPQDLSPLPAPKNPNYRGEKGEGSYYSFFVGEVNRDESGRYYDSDASCVNALAQQIRDMDSDKPLCAFLGLLAPHPEYLVEEPYFSSIDREKLPERIMLKDENQKSEMLRGLREIYGLSDWGEEQFDELRATYLGMCMKVDHFFGEIVSALKEKGIYDDTLIVFLSDHGDYTGDYDVVEKAQNTFEDCIVKVPLIIKPPKNQKVKFGISSALTELVDMYATVLDYTDVSAPETHFGNSLRDVISGDDKENREYVFCEGGRRPDETHCNSAAKNAGEENIYYPRFKMQATDACTKGTMVRDRKYKYIYRSYEQDELYDLENDPNELKNLALEIGHEKIILGMKLKMLEWYQQTCDIVPQKPDERMNDEMFISKLTQRMKADKIDQIRSFVADGFSAMEALQKIRGEEKE